MKTHNDLFFFYDQQVKSDSFYHFTVKPYSPLDSRLTIDFLKQDQDNSFLNKVLNDDLIKLNKKKFSFSANPIVSFQFSVADKKQFSQNFKYGISIKSKFGDRFFFVADAFYGMKNFTENEKHFVDSFGVIPYYSKFINKSGQLYNYFNLTGELVYAPIKSVSFHLGRGKHFFGNGFHSLFLSDNSAPYPYFKTSVDIWRVKYIWMISKLKDFELYKGETTDVIYDKAAFTHYLSLNLTKNININFFETIITNPYDLEGRRKGYEISYFNPVAFYRPVEFYTGSSDNSLMGLGLNLKFRNQYFIYSQFILDDLVISSLKEKNGWWGNKYGLQTGIKTRDLFNIKGLFVRYEFNTVKPFTYSHGESYSEEDKINLNYGHFRQAMAHPLGANFTENLFVIKYLKGRFLSQIKFMHINKGIDTDTVSYGGDIYKAYDLRNSDYDVTLLQGDLNKFNLIELSGQYLINPNYDLFLFLKGRYVSRKSSSNKDTNLFFEFGLSVKIFNENKLIY